MGDADEIKGRIKETAGAVTGEEDLEQEGKGEQAVAKLKKKRRSEGDRPGQAEGGCRQGQRKG